MESVKLGALIHSVTVAVCVWEPEVPVTTSVYCPGAAVELAVSVSVVLDVVGLGENVPVTPLGSPLTEKFTLPVNPYESETYM